MKPVAFGDGADLTGATFRGTSLAAAGLEGATLSKTRFQNCRIDDDLRRLLDGQGAVIADAETKS